jgi:hypothetical protein
MNKFKLILISLIFSLNCISAELPWYKQIFHRETWKEVSAKHFTPREASFQVKTHIEYKTGDDFEWHGGEDVWNRGTGDCKHFAITIFKLLRDNVDDKNVILFSNKRDNIMHVVVGGNYKGKYWLSSNGNYYEVKDLVEAKEVIKKELDWKVCTVVRMYKDIGA